MGAAFSGLSAVPTSPWKMHTVIGTGLLLLLLAVAAAGDGTLDAREDVLVRIAGTFGAVLAVILVLVVLAGRSRGKVIR